MRLGDGPGLVSDCTHRGAMSVPEYETGTVDAVADADEVVVCRSQH